MSNTPVPDVEGERVHPLSGLEAMIQAFAERMDGVADQAEADRISAEIMTAGAGFSAAELGEYLFAWLQGDPARRGALLGFLAAARAGELERARSQARNGGPAA